MKNIYLLSVFYCLGLMASACGTSNPMFDESREALQRFKETSNNSYTYVTSYSSWIGYYSETTVVVQKGQVQEQTFLSEDWSSCDTGPCEAVVLESWTESKDDLGSHNDGEIPALLEALYDHCETAVLTKDPDEYNIDLKFDDNGILKTCVYSEKHCQDDCGSGPHLRSVNWAI